MAKHPAKCPKCGSRLDYESAVDDLLVCPHCQAKLRAPGRGKAQAADGSDPLIGQRLGPFEVLGLLGRGGMGAVYKARQLTLDRFVALKVLPESFAHDAAFVARFRREARSAAAVNHPNIIRVFDVAEDRGYQFIAMEVVEGESLAGLLKREGRLSLGRAVELITQVASGLAEAHAKGIVHRDIKPANILLDAEGVPKVADFGLAKREGVDHSVTATGASLGTPLYMPPEVCKGQAADARSDLYSLGATFYHLLAGRPPFEAETSAALIYKHLQVDPEPLAQAAPGTPAEVCHIVHRLLRKSPAGRFQSASDLLAALSGAADTPARQVPVQAAAAPGDVTRTLPGAVGGASLPRVAREVPAHAKPMGGASPSRLFLIGGIAAAVALIVILFFILRGSRVAQPPTAVKPPTPDTQHPTPGSPALEGHAALCLQYARTCAERKEWLKAEEYLGQLASKYAATRFAADNRAAIAALRAQADAALGAPASKGPALVPDAEGWMSMFDGRTLGGWRVVEGGPFTRHGRVSVENKQITLERGDPQTGIAWSGDFPRVDYEVALDVMRLDGANDFATLVFPHLANSTRLLCTWGPSTMAVEVDGKAGEGNPTARTVAVKDSQWYRLRLRVTAPRLEVWLDDEKVVDLSTAGQSLTLHPDCLPLQPFGIYSWLTRSAVRNLRFRRVPPGPAEEWTTLPNGWRVGKPVNLGPTVNSARGESSPSVSGDGLTLFFQSDRPGGQGGSDLWMSTRRSAAEPWGTPANPGPPVNTAGEETQPCLARDGLTLYFVSTRPGGQGGTDIWASSRRSTADRWGAPENLGPIVNHSGQDGDPRIAADGLTLFLASQRQGGQGGGDLWMCIRDGLGAPWGAPVNLGPRVNTKGWESGACLSADGLTLIFSSDRPGGGGGNDLWMATRRSKAEQFGEPVNLGAQVNRSGAEMHPALSVDERTLYFVAYSGHGDSDLWQAPILPPGTEEWTTLPNGWRVGKPVSLGPTVNGPETDHMPCVSADGLTLLFASNRPGGQGGMDIWRCTRRTTGEPWGAPTSLEPPVNNPGHATDPCLSPDGLTLFFSSWGGQGKCDLWMSTRRHAADPWGVPENVGSTVNSSSDDKEPHVAADGLTLLFASDRPGGQGDHDLWMCTRDRIGAPWGQPVNLGSPVNTKGKEEGACLSADGLALFFDSDLPGRGGGRDLWMSTRRSKTEPWGEPVNLGPSVNGAYQEGQPSLSADSRTLYFASSRPNGQAGWADLWQAPLLPPEEWTTLPNGWRIGKPVNLGPTVNGNKRDTGPFVSPDGLTLLFASDRQQSPGVAIWMSTRRSAAEPWGAPAMLGPPINPKNGEHKDPCLSPHGLTLYFASTRAGGYDLWISTRRNAAEPWGAPENLGPTVNSSTAYEEMPCVAADGLTLIFTSDRPGGHGDRDLWMSTRPDAAASWGAPVNLGPAVNTAGMDMGAALTADSLTLFFSSYHRPGGRGQFDLWMASRSSKAEPFGRPVNLGALVNSGLSDEQPALSADGRTLYFASLRPGGQGERDLWQAPLLPPEPAEEWTTLPNGWRVGKAVNLGPVVNSVTEDACPSVSGDGLTLLFHSGRGGGPSGVGIWACTRRSTADPWGAPRNVGGPVNTSSGATDPCLSLDGLTLLFASRRPGGQGENDLWMSTRRSLAEPWGTPENLGPTVNSADSDFQPALAADGFTLFFTSDRPGNVGGSDNDVWMCTRPRVGAPWGTPTNLGTPVNGRKEERRAWPTADGLALFLMSNRGNALRDLWMSTRRSTAEPWGELVNLGPTVNSSAQDWGPALSADGRTLYFDSDRPGGQGGRDLWQAPVLPPGAPLPDDEARWGPWEELFDGKTLAGWQRVEEQGGEKAGTVRAQDGLLVLDKNPKGFTGAACTRALPTDDYEIVYEAMLKDGRSDIASLVFPIGQSPSVLLVGGWNQGVLALDGVDGRDARDNITTVRMQFERGRWYAVRVRVDAAQVQVWLDGQRLIAVPRAGHKFGGAINFLRLPGSPQFGLYCFHCETALRNIRLRRLKPEGAQAPKAGAK